MKPLVAALGIVLLSACSTQPSGALKSPASTASPTGSALASPSASPLQLAVLETRRAGGQESEYSGAHDTIAIAGANGYAVAKTSLIPRHIPGVPMAAAVLYPEAYTAAGAAYFIDGTGIVRRLDPSGTARRVTAFPMTSAQHGVSFAVSPDARKLMAAVLTYPTVSPGPSQDQPFKLSGSWILDLELATDGGNATVVHHWQADPKDSPGTAAGFRNLAIVGWDAVGPIGVVDGYNGAQQALYDGQRWAGGHAIRVGLDGAIGANALSDCTPVAVDKLGRVVCVLQDAHGTTTSIRIARLDGGVIWSTAALPAQFIQAVQAGGFALSPDGQQVAMDGVVVRQHGPNLAISNTFLTRGWLDNDTLIGLIQGSEPMKIGILRLSSPTSIENWGFTGEFVGLLR
jgi:hypothetical protein